MDAKKVFWDGISELYQHVIHKRCVCYVNARNSREMLDEIFGSQEFRNVCKTEETSPELHLLSSSVIQMMAKLFLHSDDGYVCREIALLLEHVVGDPFLDLQIYHLINSRNKFLQRAILRSLTCSLYLLNEERFTNAVNKLLDLLKSSSSESSTINLLNLFELIMQCSLKSIHVLKPRNVKCRSDENLACKHRVLLSCCSLNDLKFKCYTVLSNNWEDLVKIFFDQSVAKQSQVLIAFLCLWRSCLKTVNEGEVLKPLLLSNELLISLFVSSPPNEPLSLKIFLKILIQSLSLEDSYITHGRRANEYQGGKLLINAINSGFLENLPVGEYKSGFGGACTGARCKAVGQSVLQSYRKSTATYDEITVKKIVFIVLKILSASKISTNLLTAFANTEAFLRHKMCINTDTPAYLWILDFFFDQDDLLIDSLLCSLNLYINLEGTERIDDVPNDDIIKLRNSLNPHKAFINFLQRIGGDHHVMLDFLMSSDTYILNYLMQYLKLGVSEWEQFVSAHKVLENCKIHSQDSETNICGEKCYSLANDSDFSFKENGCSSSVPVTSEKFQQAHLVSYSSSSSSSSDSELSPIPVTKFPQSLYSCKEMITPDWTISVLANLRQALEKLVGCQEFPYRINPLTELLRKCENMNKR